MVSYKATVRPVRAEGDPIVRRRRVLGRKSGPRVIYPSILSKSLKVITKQINALKSFKAKKQLLISEIEEKEIDAQIASLKLERDSIKGSFYSDKYTNLISTVKSTIKDFKTPAFVKTIIGYEAPSLKTIFSELNITKTEENLWVLIEWLKMTGCIIIQINNF